MTREEIVSDVQVMINGLETLWSLYELQTIAVDQSKPYTMYQLVTAPIPHYPHLFRLDYVINRESTPDRFIIEILCEGIATDFYPEITSVVSLKPVNFNGSKYDA